MNEEADQKLREALNKNNINPCLDVINKDTYMRLVSLIVQIFGRCLCTMGRKEITNVNWDEIKIKLYCTGPDKGMYHVDFIPEGKQQQDTPYYAQLPIPKSL